MGPREKANTPIAAFEIRERVRQTVEVGLTLAKSWF